MKVEPIVVDMDTPLGFLFAAAYATRIHACGVVKEIVATFAKKGWDATHPANRKMIIDVIIEKCFEDWADRSARDSDERDIARDAFRRTLDALLRAERKAGGQ